MINTRGEAPCTQATQLRPAGERAPIEHACKLTRLTVLISRFVRQRYIEAFCLVTKHVPKSLMNFISIIVLLSPRLHQPSLDRVGHGGGAARDAKFVVDVPQMVLHRFPTDDESVRDLRITQPLCQPA